MDDGGGCPIQMRRHRLVDDAAVASRHRPRPPWQPLPDHDCPKAASVVRLSGRSPPVRTPIQSGWPVPPMACPVQPQNAPLPMTAQGDYLGTYA